MARSEFPQALDALVDERGATLQVTDTDIVILTHRVQVHLGRRAAPPANYFTTSSVSTLEPQEAELRNRSGDFFPLRPCVSDGGTRALAIALASA
jgi:hypothetical protein